MQATADVPSGLISLIYATSNDASKWPDVCAALNHHAGAGGKIRNAQGLCACPKGLVFIRGKCATPKAVPPTGVTC